MRRRMIKENRNCEKLRQLVLLVANWRNYRMVVVNNREIECLKRKRRSHSVKPFQGVLSVSTRRQRTTSYYRTRRGRLVFALARISDTLIRWKGLFPLSSQP